jgi:tRNA(Ile)-lysidine synthetase-like protein
MNGVTVDRIQAAVDGALPVNDRSLLAVSGGMDSMVLLHAALEVRSTAQLAVATFDHGSGPHSAEAVELVERTAMSNGLAVVVGRAEPVERPSEAAWREARLAFLRGAAAEFRATICTAHTRDDQVETILFRELRGAGPRGLAGLAAQGDILRPLLPFTRRDVADYARTAGVQWVDDPTKVDRSYSRNRLRHDVFPAMRAVRPGIDADLADLGERAARWRADVDALVDTRIRFDADREMETLEVDRDSLHGLAPDALGIHWPAHLARIGVAADWRGTSRLVAFTTEGTSGQRIQLSGGWTVYRRRGAFEVRRDAPTER